MLTLGGRGASRNGVPPKQPWCLFPKGYHGMKWCR